MKCIANETFNYAVSFLKRKLNLSNEKIAHKLGVSVATFHRWIHNQAKPQSKNLENLLELAEKENINFEQFQMSIMLLKIIDNFDAYTFVHVQRVAVLSRILAKESGLDYLTAFDAAYLHDLGKIFVDKNILNKPEKLTDDEFEEMKKHTVVTQHLLENLLPGNKKISLLAGQHHEKINGRGYPYGLKDISEESKIISVCDVFDALTSTRIYKKQFSVEEAFLEMKNIEKSGLDLQYINKLEEIISKNPNLLENLENENHKYLYTIERK